MLLNCGVGEDSTHGHHQTVNTEIRLIIFFAVKNGEALYSQQKTRPGADCDSDHELLIAKFRLKLKKVGKTTRNRWGNSGNRVRLYFGGLQNH